MYTLAVVGIVVMDMVVVAGSIVVVADKRSEVVCNWAAVAVVD